MEGGEGNAGKNLSFFDRDKCDCERPDRLTIFERDAGEFSSSSRSKSANILPQSSPRLVITLSVLLRLMVTSCGARMGLPPVRHAGDGLWVCNLGTFYGSEWSDAPRTVWMFLPDWASEIVCKIGAALAGGRGKRKRVWRCSGSLNMFSFGRRERALPDSKSGVERFYGPTHDRSGLFPARSGMHYLFHLRTRYFSLRIEQIMLVTDVDFSRRSKDDTIYAISKRRYQVG